MQTIFLMKHSFHYKIRVHFYYTFLIVLFILFQTAKMSSTSRRQAYTGGEKLAVVKYSEAPSSKAASRHIDVSTRRTFACVVSRKSAFSRCRIPRMQTQDASLLFRSWKPSCWSGYQIVGNKASVYPSSKSISMPSS